MKKYLISLLAVSAFLFASSCDTEKPEAPTTGPDYSKAVEQEAITIDIEMEKNDEYGGVTITIDQDKLTAAFGPSLDNVVLYGFTKDSKEIFGETYYTSENGFFLTSEGIVCMPSAQGCKVFIDLNNTASALKLALGQFPESCEPGESFSVKVGLATTEIKVPIVLNISIAVASEWAVFFEHSDGLTYSLYETVDNEYQALEVFINETVLCKALGVSSAAQIVSGLTANPATITFTAVLPDGSLYDGASTANGYGHWFDSTGTVCSWQGTDWSAFSEWGGATPISFRIGQATTGVEVGEKFVLRQRFTKGDKTATLTFILHIVEKVTADLGPDEE